MKNLSILFVAFLLLQINTLAQDGWFQQISGTTNSLSGVSFTDSDNGTAVGRNGTILRTTNGGAIWTLQTSGTIEWLYGVSFTDLDNGTAVGEGGTILRTTDGGTIWTPQISGTTERLSGVSFTDSDNGTAVGDDGTILRTTDGGTTWTSQTSGTTVWLWSVSFTDSDNGTAVGNGGTIIRTTDGGTTWTPQSSGTTEPLNGVSFTDSDNGTAVGRDGIIRTIDGGVTWDSQTSGTGWLFSVSFTDSDNGTVVGGQFMPPPSNQAILRTTDGGATWEVQLQGHGASLYGVCFTDSDNGTAVGNGGIILKTTTGGVIPVELSSFTASTSQGKVYLNWTTATEINNLGFEIERKILNVGDGEWITIGFREGNGTTTEPKEYSYVDVLSDIEASSLSYRLKQIDFDGSYEYSDEVFVDNPAPSDYALHQNFPNPYNPATTITYSLPVNAQVELVIYNTLGESITRLVNEKKEAGKYSVKFDATNLPSGIYFYRIQAGSFVETKKMILLK